MNDGECCDLSAIAAKNRVSNALPGEYGKGPSLAFVSLIWRNGPRTPQVPNLGGRLTGEDLTKSLLAKPAESVMLADIEIWVRGSRAQMLRTGSSCAELPMRVSQSSSSN